MLPAQLKTILLIFTTFPIERSLVSLSIYFYHAIPDSSAMLIGAHGEKGKNLSVQNSKAAQEHPGTDRWPLLCLTPIPHITRTLKVISASIPHDGTCMSHAGARHPPIALLRMEGKWFSGQESNQHRLRPERGTAGQMFLEIFLKIFQLSIWVNICVGT